MYLYDINTDIHILVFLLQDMILQYSSSKTLQCKVKQTKVDTRRKVGSSFSGKMK